MRLCSIVYKINMTKCINISVSVLKETIAKIITRWELYFDAMINEVSVDAESELL